MALTQSPEMTERKLAAQRSNARRSTGPRTEAGKSRSRWNAFRHGGWAGGRAWSDEALRAVGEDPEDFLRLRRSLQQAWGPGEDRLGDALIEDLARLYWRRARLEHAWQMVVLNQRVLSPYRQALASVSTDGLPLLKQIEALDRAVDRKVRLLLRLREAEDRRKGSGSRASSRHPGEAAPEILNVEERSHDVVEKKGPEANNPEPEARPPASPAPSAGEERASEEMAEVFQVRNFKSEPG
jgi:hypothetical protein